MGEGRGEGHERNVLLEVTICDLKDVRNAECNQRASHRSRTSPRGSWSSAHCPRRSPSSGSSTRLIDGHVAVWDVCKTAHRPGSLDSSIRHPKPNDFAAFLEGHPRIKLICFNGAKAAELFGETRESLDRTHPKMQYRTLPSTSPANARMSFSEKLASWSIVREESL